MTVSISRKNSSVLHTIFEGQIVNDLQFINTNNNQ